MPLDFYIFNFEVAYEREIKKNSIHGNLLHTVCRNASFILEVFDAEGQLCEK